jgi:predicted O-methyltransferase YrrM
MAELPLGLTEDALRAAAEEAEPESLAAAERLRRQFGPALAAAAVTQVVLRRRAAVKFGSAAEGLFFTRTGLEQASRPAVAQHHAARLVASGARQVVDLGCGIGTDTLAFARAGLPVLAVDNDPVVAEVARANAEAADLPVPVEVVVANAEDVTAELASGAAVFCDPSRRTSAGRSWRVDDLTPGWPFVTGLFGRPQPVGVKLGPGLPHELIGRQVEAEWVGESGDTVEVGLWSGPGAVPGIWSALVLSVAAHRLVSGKAGPPPVDQPRTYLYEPVGAVIRSRGIPALAVELDAAALHPGLAYLTSDQRIHTPFAVGFAVEQAFPYKPTLLGRWLADAGIGTLEIKTRGLQIDPARLRRSLRLRGRGSATIVITRTLDGPTVLVVTRL